MTLNTIGYLTDVCVVGAKQFVMMDTTGAKIVRNAQCAEKSVMRATVGTAANAQSAA